MGTTLSTLSDYWYGTETANTENSSLTAAIGSATLTNNNNDQTYNGVSGTSDQVIGSTTLISGQSI